MLLAFVSSVHLTSNYSGEDLEFSSKGLVMGMSPFRGKTHFPKK